MPFFVFMARDKPQSGHIRAANREKHRLYIRIDQRECRCLHGGPLMSSDGVQMIGTLLIFEATDQRAVEAFVSADPYWQAELFADYSIDLWNWGYAAAVGRSAE